MFDFQKVIHLHFTIISFTLRCFKATSPLSTDSITVRCCALAASNVWATFLDSLDISPVLPVPLPPPEDWIFE